MNKEKEPPSIYSTLLLERRNGIVQITLNRPAKLNALNSQLQNDLGHALGVLSADATVQVVILTGSGRAFCAGLDLAEFRESLAHFQSQPRQDTIFGKLTALPQPVIGAINGAAVTGGFELALACDVLIASGAARFADTHAQLGVMPGAGLSQKLSRIIGLPRAMALSLTGEFLEAEDAHRCGLVSQLTSPDMLLPEAWRLAERMAQADSAVLQKMKRLMNAGAARSLAEGLRLEQEAHGEWARDADLAAVDMRRERVMERNRTQPSSR